MDVVASLGKSYEWERPTASGHDSELRQLEKVIQAQLGDKWAGFLKAIESTAGAHGEIRWRSLTLLFAHLLRLPISNSSLQRGAISRLLKLLDSSNLLHRTI